MSFTIPISGGALGAAILWVGTRAYRITADRVKKWDKHCNDDDTLHAVIKSQLVDMDNRLKSVDEKVDRLIDHMIAGNKS